MVVKWGLTLSVVGSKKLPMTKQKQSMFPFLPSEQSAAVEKAIAEYKGYAPRVSHAIGALVLGQLYGWRAIVMIHSRSNIREFEAILGVTFRDVMPDRTELSDRILGVRIADELGKFWAVVKGDVSVPGKSYVDDAGQSDLFIGGAAGGRAS